MQGSFTRSSGHVASRLANGLPPAASSSSLQLPDTDAEDEDGHDDPRQQHLSGALNPMEASYVDPLGPSAERPRTAVKTRRSVPEEFADDCIVDNLLPD